MPLVLRDRVQETTTTLGTGTLTLAGASTGFQSFSVIGNGNTTYYTITDDTNWETGIGTYTSAGTTLSRDTVLESSNGGALVNWGAGVKKVFVTYPAERAITASSTQTNALEIPNPSTSGNILNSNGTAWLSSTHTGCVLENTVSAAGTATTVVLTKAGNTSLNFTNESYLVVFRDVGTTSGGILYMRYTTNSAGSQDASSSYRWTNYFTSIIGTQQGTPSTQWQITPFSVGSGNRTSGAFFLDKNPSVSRTYTSGTCQYFDGAYGFNSAIGVYFTGGTVYGMAFFCGAGNILGNIDLYKMVRA